MCCLEVGPLEDLIVNLILTLRMRCFFTENVGTVPLNKLLHRCCPIGAQSDAQQQNVFGFFLNKQSSSIIIFLPHN